MKTKNKFFALRKKSTSFMMLFFLCSTSHVFAESESLTLGSCHEKVNDKTITPSENASCNGLFTTENLANSNSSPENKNSKAGNSAKCDALKRDREKAAKPYIAVGNNEDQDGSPGSSSMQKCVKLSGFNMRYLYGPHKKTINWTVLTDASQECIDASPECAGTDRDAKVKICEDLKKFAGRCDAAAFIINEYGRDWTSPEQVKPTNVKGLTPEINCSAMGIETLDYEACAKFVQNGQVMEAAQAAVYTGQQLYYQDQTMTAQMQAASSPESATAGLQALKAGVKGQQDIMTQRAALDSGKFAAFASYYSDMPSYEELKEKCKNYQPIEGLENECVSTVSQPGFAFLMNQPAKEKMKAKLAQVGINVASDAVMADLMAKRAGDISNAIAKVDAFKPIDPLAPAQDNMQSTYCQANPGDSKCLSGGLDKTFDAMSDNVITFGDGGTGTAYTNNTPYVDPTAGTIDSKNPTNKNSIGSVGSVIPHAQQNGGLESKAAAATVSKGSAPSAAGGGGGGGGGVGGGGGGAPGTQPQGGVSAAIQGKTPSYGGGSGTLSMMGGFGINKSKSTAKDDSNPFGKLFNKNGNKSGVINFQGRAPASVGNKGDNIFEMISKRYTTVSSDKRLLEYELAN